MAYIRKTREEVLSESTYAEARQRLREYRVPIKMEE